MSQPIIISWHCLHYVGQSKWQNTEDFEPDECDTLFETEDDLANWSADLCSATCPECGAELTQEHDGPELVLIEDPWKIAAKQT